MTSPISHILSLIESGNPAAAEKLLPLVYDELRKLAAARLASEKPGQTLDATGLVHEAYLRLVGNGQSVQWDGRGHFFAAAATAMRRILIENARRKSRVRHGGELKRVELADPAMATEDARLLDLDEALTELEREDALAAQVVELHHFARLSHEDAAAALGVSVYQVRQKWTYARAWLQSALAP